MTTSSDGEATEEQKNNWLSILRDVDVVSIGGVSITKHTTDYNLCKVMGLITAV